MWSICLSSEAPPEHSGDVAVSTTCSRVSLNCALGTQQRGKGKTQWLGWQRTGGHRGRWWAECAQRHWEETQLALSSEQDKGSVQSHRPVQGEWQPRGECVWSLCLWPPLKLIAYLHCVHFCCSSGRLLTRNLHHREAICGGYGIKLSVEKSFSFSASVLSKFCMVCEALGCHSLIRFINKGFYHKLHNSRR